MLQLFLKLLNDPIFKHDYTVLFVKCYTAYINNILHDEKDDVAAAISKFLDRISCQLFHDEALCFELTSEGCNDGSGMLNTLLDIAISLLAEGTKPSGHPGMRELCPESRVVTKHLFGRFVPGL